MRKMQSIALSVVIGLVLTSCDSNPVKPPPLPIPPEPQYLQLSPEELDLLKQCTDKEVCEIYRESLEKLLKNKLKRESYINQLKGSLEATR